MQHKIEHDIKELLKHWPQLLQKYAETDTKKAVLQIFTSFVPFLGVWVLMYFVFDWSYLVTFLLSIVNGFFLVRIFIIQHDCGHQSFLKNRFWNHFLGFFCSFFSSLPYKYWARSHSFHHAHSGQLENLEI